jgi:hypothetical protein
MNGALGRLRSAPAQTASVAATGVDPFWWTPPTYVVSVLAIPLMLVAAGGLIVTSPWVSTPATPGSCTTRQGSARQVVRPTSPSDGGADADEEVHARLVATKAAIAQLDALPREEWTRNETVERMRALYEDRPLAYQHMVQLVLGRSARHRCECEATASSRTRR